MADLLKDAATWLAGQRKAHASQSVTYSRGAASVSLSATIGRRIDQVDRESGFHTETEDRDYLIDTADLVLSGSVTLPEPGDQIVEIDGDKQHTYEVMSPPGDEPHFRYSDNHRVTLRIHTKRIKTEPAP